MLKLSSQVAAEPFMAEYPHPPTGPQFGNDNSVTWYVWAPHAHAVKLVLLKRKNGPERIVAMNPEGNGYFSHSEQHVAEEQLYAFRIDDGPNRPDPASRWQPH